ncbi:MULTISPECIES: methylmalonyl-CoA epimerase [Halobacteriovorax]|uniref:Methylmalonyl-CoA epimerase n=1 Tax=Halobacteriovorax vibrionivorans TaxID=2152716 RepID=A0ABY0IDC1_9BACT|nr:MULTISPECIES: methylmalonyl-CoA epimerase [Halobacteriovorax]AYF44888.1 methylmalonyl-CoA epimerase [Halobacteriovorax sp. BALOs_7]RZF20961.1 methylmalonyl-CoA epimerase [Halobacteriovorax vibrionivorans]TGD46804.1 methylmalonyl-CoA epimerase [Halobacteriovorax sp. Y22]
MFNKDCFLDHIAIAVENLDNAEKIYRDLGLTFNHREVVEDQQVTTSFAHIDENAHVELLEPIDGKGPIAKYLEKKGPGIHHMCYRVPDVTKKSQELRDLGYNLLYETPRQGANNCLVNFIHPKSTGGVLIEIAQKM